MNIYTSISVAATVLSFVVFIGIVAWAYSKRRRPAFDEAANAPFALPDETIAGAQTAPQRAERRS
jgi:cytochrome c oxidase cbb3-type subunit IV